MILTLDCKERSWAKWCAGCNALLSHKGVLLTCIFMGIPHGNWAQSVTHYPDFKYDNVMPSNALFI